MTEAMNKIAIIAAALLLIPALGRAQPAGFLKYYQDLGNSSDLFLTFCLFGDHVCIDRKAVAWGQLCDSEAAREIGTGETGEYEGVVPFGFHYSGFRCSKNGKWHPKTSHIFGGGNWST